MLGWIVVAAAVVAAGVLLNALGGREDPPPPVASGSLERYVRLAQAPYEEHDHAATWIACPICGCPTAPRYCPVCEWEDELPQAEDELAARRSFFHETGSIYTSMELADWMGTRPGADERALQRSLLELTARARAGEIHPADWWADFSRDTEALRAVRAARVTGA